MPLLLGADGAVPSPDVAHLGRLIAYLEHERSVGAAIAAVERYEPLPPSYYEGFCVLPSGATYDCDPVRRQ